MLQFNEPNGTLVSGIRFCYQWLPHGQIIPKCVINQENANKPICTCYLEVGRRNGLSSLFENVTFLCFECSSCSPVVHVFFFSKITFSVKYFRLFVIRLPGQSLEWREKCMSSDTMDRKLFFQWPLAIQFKHCLKLYCVPGPVLNGVGVKLTV